MTTVEESNLVLESEATAPAPKKLPKIHKTPFGLMDNVEYRLYVKSLTPSPISVQYRVLSCGHKYSKLRRPIGGCKTCWDAALRDHPEFLSTVMMSITTGNKDLVVHSFGKEAVKQCQRFHDQHIAEPAVAA